MTLDGRLAELLRIWQDCRRHGQTPTPADLCQDCPELLGPFQEALANLQNQPTADQATRFVTPIIDPQRHTPAYAIEIPEPTEGSSGPRAPVALIPGAEPVPGYRLEALLGRGGFGEVWKAIGPGGFPVALKMLRVGNSPLAAPEVRSLTFLKDIRHANLLSIFGAWLAQDLLVIAMELADRTLLDRSKELTLAGTPGIPFPELVEAMQDAARGIDFLNEPRHTIDGREGIAIQHRDIKPHNLFLVGGSVKVGDFGLARILENSWTQHSGSMTPAYAAPEFFQGQTAATSDQYSLAITYCHLRTGYLPFAGNIAQITAGHLMKAPNLTMVPPAERPVVAKALAKKPELRWPTCRAFVRALQQAVEGGLIVTAPRPPAPPPPPPGTPETPPPAPPSYAAPTTKALAAAAPVAPVPPSSRKVVVIKPQSSARMAKPALPPRPTPAPAPPAPAPGPEVVVTTEPPSSGKNRLGRPSPSARKRELQQRRDQIRVRLKWVVVGGIVLVGTLLGRWLLLALGK